MSPDENKYGRPDESPAVPASSPSDDAAALRAIEALEAETSALDSTPVPAAAPEPKPVTSEPVKTPEPIINEPSARPVPNKPLIPVIPPAEPAGESKIETPSKPGLDLSASLGDSTAPSPTFTPFKSSRKPLNKRTLILIIVASVLILGIGGYFGWQYYQSQNTPVVTTQETPEPADKTEETTITDTETSVNEAVSDIETQLEGIDESEYAESTLSDESLYE